jgi:transposase InsO family protein
MKYQFIFAGHVRYPVLLQCEVLDVSRAGYYQWRTRTASARERANVALVARMKVLHQLHKGRYGSPRMTVALQREGYACSRNRIARLMRLDGLAARTKRKYCRTTISDHRLASPNLLERQFTVCLPDRVLTSDITYVSTNEGWLYVATVMDLCTRKVVGLSMRSDMTAELVSDALNQAIARRQLTSGTILHSDRGVQYSSDAYRSIIAKHGFIQSMSRKGDCWDNAPMESFFKTLKVELIYPKKQYQTREEAARSIFEYIEIYYNRQRMHSGLNYQSPEDFEANLTITSTRSDNHINCM